MEETKIIQKIQGIFQDIFDDESIVLNRETNANDIEEWDSLNHIMILEAVQNEFRVKFELDEIIEMKSIGDMIDSIKSKLL